MEKEERKQGKPAAMSNTYTILSRNMEIVFARVEHILGKCHEMWSNEPTQTYSLPSVWLAIRRGARRVVKAGVPSSSLSSILLYRGRRRRLLLPRRTGTDCDRGVAVEKFMSEVLTKGAVAPLEASVFACGQL